ncbi:MAG: hypothetical protein ABMA14_18120 [Hyphomonadaceae bacterium]
MRGVWENEKSLSPALLRSALGTVGVFLALSSAVMLVIAVASVAAGYYAAAAMQLAAGIALPFGIWLGLRILADMLVVLHRSQDRLDMIVQLAGGQAPVAPEPVFTANGAAVGRAGDDGPAYPMED